MGRLGHPGLCRPPGALPRSHTVGTGAVTITNIACCYCNDSKFCRANGATGMADFDDVEIDEYDRAMTPDRTTAALISSNRIIGNAPAT